jgi:hypothetical protein
MALESKLADIKKYISLKQETHIGDIIILVTGSDIFYATVRDIRPDIKKDWYSVHVTMLSMPPVELTWKLRQQQMSGEIFTINGKEHFMAAVAFDPEPADTIVKDRDCKGIKDQSEKILQFTPKNQPQERRIE